MIIQISKMLKETEEEDSIYEDDIMQIYAVTPGYKNWEGCLYIKVFTKKDDNDNELTNISRISMLSPEYISCEFENYKLSKDQIDHLIKVLNTYRDPIEFDDNITFWQLIILYNNIYRRSGDKSIPIINNDLPIPNYYKLLDM